MQLVFSIFLFFAFSGLFGQGGYAIDIQLKPYKNEKIYIGYHYGKMKALADSAVLDNSIPSISFLIESG